MEWIHIVITSPTQNISPNDQTIGQTTNLIEGRTNWTSWDSKCLNDECVNVW